MSYVRSFAPWIAYAVLSSFADWRVASTVAAALAVAAVVQQRRDGSADLISIGTLGFFVSVAAASIAAPHNGFHHWTPVASVGTLGILAACSLAAGRPFTLAIARRTVTAEVAAHPVFLRVNQVITGVWTAAFLTSAAIQAVLLRGDGHHPVALAAVQVTAFVVPAAFTRHYPDRVRARFAAPAPAVAYAETR